MIKSFKCKDTERLFNRKFVKKFSGIERQCVKKLDRLDASPDLEALAGFPGNHFEKLTGDRKGSYSIRVKDQWRICFEWNEGAENVEIVDYH
jgi:toxin HigB-1